MCSSRRTWFVPGIGTTNGFCANSQASANCAELQFSACACAFNSSTRRRLRRRLSPSNRGILRRTSPEPNAPSISSRSGRRHAAPFFRGGKNPPAGQRKGAGFLDFLPGRSVIFPDDGFFWGSGRRKRAASSVAGETDIAGNALDHHGPHALSDRRVRPGPSKDRVQIPIRPRRHAAPFFRGGKNPPAGQRKGAGFLDFLPGRSVIFPDDGFFWGSGRRKRAASSVAGETDIAGNALDHHGPHKSLPMYSIRKGPSPRARHGARAGAWTTT